MPKKIEKKINGYYSYIEDVRSGKIITSQYIKQQVERLERMKEREDIFFDERAVEDCFEFIYQMKHFAGKSARTNFELLPWQKWCIGSVIGIKYKESRLRVCRELFIMMARKNGKSSLIAALALYMLIADGEASPSVGCVASSRDQARILFEMCQQYGKSLDPKEDMLYQYRNYMKFPANNGELKVFSSDADSLDGLSMSFLVADEVHSYKDNKLISVMKSSMGFREQPLLVEITTAGFLLDGYPCYETYKMSIELLAGVKEQDSFFPFLYVMDPEDEWTNEENWIKCNPCLDTTVTRSYLRDQVQTAKNDATQEVPIKTKNFNLFCNAAQIWVPQEDVAKVMKTLNVEDFRGYVGYVGLDLASVSDLSGLSLMIPKDGQFYFFNWAFLPRDTFVKSPNHDLYQHFVNEGGMYITEGNVTDYQYIVNKIMELSQIVQIHGVHYDPYNSSQLAIACTDLGINMQPCPQGIMAFTNPTKEFERLIKSEKAVIDKSTMFVWEMNNATLMTDHNANCKPTKGGTISGKIDNVICCCEAVSGYLKNPMDSDFDLFVL